MLKAWNSTAGKLRSSNEHNISKTVAGSLQSICCTPQTPFNSTPLLTTCHHGGSVTRVKRKEPVKERLRMCYLCTMASAEVISTNHLRRGEVRFSSYRSNPTIGDTD